MKNIIITGGSAGIGLSLVNKFRQGYHVFTISRNIDNIKDLANVTAIQGDITKSDDIKKLIALVADKDIDGIISNAAYGMPEVLSLASSTDELYKTFETNFFAPIKLITGLLKQNKLNRVLNLSSGAAEFPLASLLSYCTSKAAIHHAMRCLNIEYPQTKFANLRPGMVDTPLQERWRGVESSVFPNGNFYQQAKDENKLIHPDDVAEFTYKVWHTQIESFAKDWNILTDKL